MFKHNIDIGNLWDHTHQDRDVRVAQNRLHHDLVLNFLEEFVCQSRVKDLLDGNRGAVQLSFVDYTETTLGNFLTEFNVRNSDLSDSWNWWKSA